MTIQQNIYSFLSVFLKLEHSTGQVGNANSYHGTQLAVAVSSAFFLIFPHPSMSIEETLITNNITRHQFHLCIEESNGSHTRTVTDSQVTSCQSRRGKSGHLWDVR